MSIEKRERKRKTAKGAEGQYDNEKASASTEMADSGLQAADFGSDTDTRANLTVGVPSVADENLEQFTERLTEELLTEERDRNPDADKMTLTEALAPHVRVVAEPLAYVRYFEALNESARAGNHISLEMQSGINVYNRRYLQDNYPNVDNDPRAPEGDNQIGKSRAVCSWADLESLPNETKVDTENRKATTTYLMHDDGDGHKVYAELTTANNRQSKSMRNSVTVFRHEMRNGLDVKTYEPFADSLMIRQTPPSRYSEKALIASHDEMIYELQDYMGDSSSNPRITEGLRDVFQRGFEKGNDLEDQR